MRPGAAYCAGHGLSAAGYHEDEHTPRLVRSLAGSEITFAAAGLANSGESPEMPPCSLTVEPPNAPQLSSHNRRCQCSALYICLPWALRLQLVAGCVDDSGTAYIWGPALRQSFGSASSEVDKPQPVPGIHHAVGLAIGGCHVLVQEHSGAVASYGANEYGVLGHGSDSASKGTLPARIPDVQFEQVCVLTLLPCY